MMLTLQLQLSPSRVQVSNHQTRTWTPPSPAVSGSRPTANDFLLRDAAQNARRRPPSRLFTADQTNPTVPDEPSWKAELDACPQDLKALLPLQDIKIVLPLLRTKAKIAPDFFAKTVATMNERGKDASLLSEANFANYRFVANQAFHQAMDPHLALLLMVKILEQDFLGHCVRLGATVMQEFAGRRSLSYPIDFDSYPDWNDLAEAHPQFSFYEFIPMNYQDAGFSLKSVERFLRESLRRPKAPHMFIDSELRPFENIYGHFEKKMWGFAVSPYCLNLRHYKSDFLLKHAEGNPAHLTDLAPHPYLGIIHDRNHWNILFRLIQRGIHRNCVDFFRGFQDAIAPAPWAQALVAAHFDYWTIHFSNRFQNTPAPFLDIAMAEHLDKLFYGLRDCVPLKRYAKFMFPWALRALKVPNDHYREHGHFSFHHPAIDALTSFLEDPQSHSEAVTLLRHPKFRSSLQFLANHQQIHFS